jgi:hypothetical protein
MSRNTVYLGAGTNARPVVWIGDVVEMIDDLGAIQHFKDAEQFCRAIVREAHAQPKLRLAA